MKKAISIFLFVLLLSGTALAADPIKIGVLQPITGFAAYEGIQNVNGAKLAVKEINDKGGVLGRPIEVIVEDTKGVPSETVNATKKLITRDRVVALYGPNLSTESLAVMPVVKDEKIVLMGGTSVANQLTQMGNEWYFRLNQTSDQEAKAFIAEWKNLGIKNVAFLAEDGAWGRSTVDSYSKAFKAINGDVVAIEYYPGKETDFYPYLTRIRGKKPQALDFIGLTSPISIMAKAFHELGMNKEMFFLGSDGSTADDFIKNAGPAAEGLWAVHRWHYTYSDPASVRFVKVYREMFGGQVPEAAAQSGYDGIRLLADAMTRAGSADREKIREALVKADFEGLLGRIRFDKDRQNWPDMVILNVKDGKFRIVKKLPSK